MKWYLLITQASTPTSDKMMNYYKHLIKDKDDVINSLKKELQKAKLMIIKLKSGNNDESDDKAEIFSDRSNKPIAQSYVNSFAHNKQQDPKLFIKNSIVKQNANITSFFRQPSNGKKLNESVNSK
jgi:hypothetical protein